MFTRIIGIVLKSELICFCPGEKVYITNSISTLPGVNMYILTRLLYGACSIHKHVSNLMNFPDR